MFEVCLILNKQTIFYVASTFNRRKPVEYLEKLKGYGYVHYSNSIFLF